MYKPTKVEEILNNKDLPSLFKSYNDREIAELLNYKHSTVTLARYQLGIKPNRRIKKGRKLSLSKEQIKEEVAILGTQMSVAKKYGVTRQAVNWYLKKGVD